MPRKPATNSRRHHETNTHLHHETTTQREGELKSGGARSPAAGQSTQQRMAEFGGQRIFLISGGSTSNLRVGRLSACCPSHRRPTHALAPALSRISCPSVYSAPTPWSKAEGCGSTLNCASASALLRLFSWLLNHSSISFQNVLDHEHVLGNRTLEVKIATPKVSNTQIDTICLCGLSQGVVEMIKFWFFFNTGRNEITRNKESYQDICCSNSAIRGWVDVS
jgi:hypothetical protein